MCGGLRSLRRTFRSLFCDLHTFCSASIESRGNLIAAPLAFEMKLPLVRPPTHFLSPRALAASAQLTQITQVLIRKSSKSPGCTVSVDFRVGYGTEHLEIADDAVQVNCPRTRHVTRHVYIQHLKLLQPGQRVFIVDDLLGSGTTMQVSACEHQPGAAALFHSRFRLRANSSKKWAVWWRPAAASALCQSCTGFRN
jgi:hypothetical protein